MAVCLLPQVNQFDICQFVRELLISFGNFNSYSLILQIFKIHQKCIFIKQFCIKISFHFYSKFKLYITIMHPKRFRDRIEKADRFLVSRNNVDQLPSGRTTGYESTNFNNSSPSLTQLHKAVLQIAMRLQSATKNSGVLGGYSEQMQARDHYAIVQPPKLSQQKNFRQKQIKLWLAQICHRVFSVSFNYFSNKIFDMQMTKSFSSQCFILNVISLSKNNELTKQDFQLINLHLKKQLLPYFLLRYPQSNNKEVNQKLNKSVAATDYLDTNENNMFLKSKIIFQYRQNGIYFDFIMKFLNYIQQLPQKQIEGSNGLTLFDDFIQLMQKLFTSTYKRRWTQSNIYDIFIQQNQSVQTLRSNVQHLQNQIQKSVIKQIIQLQQHNQNMQNINSQKDYQQVVKQYTKYAINRKVSENVRLYTPEQIFHGNIKILSPAILRIIVKWCSELQQKFEYDYFTQRNQPFVMITGDEVQMNDEFRQKLNEYLSEEWIEIQKFLSTISNNIHEKQAELSFNNLMYYSTHKLSQTQQSLIKFANRNTQDVNHYAISYLNRLIHGLIKISKKIYDQHLKGWAQWPYPPTLISFTMSDLMRCKCSSKQKQIIRIYKELQIQSLINPHLIKIVKVKNRLTKGTKDILINVVFHQEALCEIQLAIKVDHSQFTLWSDQFNHYIYELQRSSYGPITQMCSIWCSLDQRSTLLKSQKIRVPDINHTCQNIQNISQIFPFTCSLCFRHYSQSRYIYDHQKCKCNKFWTCALCRLQTLNQQQLVGVLNKKTLNPNIGERILHQNKFPQYFIGFKLQSTRPVGRIFRKFMLGKEALIVSIQNNKLKVSLFKKKDKDSQLKKKLFEDFIFFSHKSPDARLMSIQIQQVLNETVLEQIAECYKRKSQSLRITRKNITTQLLTQIKNPRAQQNIDSLIFPQNKIASIKQIAEAFPNTKMLNLIKNKIQSLQGICKMKKLTDLYLGENQFKQIIELDDLTNLKYLQLGDNTHSPQFKCNLQKLQKLESLTLIRSNLSKFPEQVCKLYNLKLLWLFQNRITKIPSIIKNLIFLQYFHLQMNQLVELPQEVYSLTNLKKLMLSYNKIKHISQNVSNLQLLQILSLQDNPLQNIPFESIKRLKSLQMITLNKNYQAQFVRNKITAAIFR